MGASPKTTDFLKECMADAILQAMREKPFSKITIQEIAEMAGVNRSTWFRNFGDKNEAISFKLIRLWNRWADEHGLKERRRYTLDNAEDFFAFNFSMGISWLWPCSVRPNTKSRPTWRTCGRALGCASFWAESGMWRPGTGWRARRANPATASVGRHGI